MTPATPPAADTLRTPAKINLFLAVSGRRPDGFHDIETLFAPLEAPADTVALAPAADTPGVSIACDHPDVPCDGRNLCHKAAMSFAERMGLTPRWAISINKGIPVAAGLGGGSSDAAAALRLLGKIYGAPSEVLAECADAVGSDTRFFLDPRPAVGRGRGERLEPLERAAPVPVVLCAPLFPVSAAWAYANRLPARPGAPTVEDARSAWESGDLRRVAACVRNDLAAAVRLKFPVLDLLAEELAAAGALAVEVSGSGPTLFGVFPSHAAAESAAARLSASRGGDGVVAVATRAAPPPGAHAD